MREWKVIFLFCLVFVCFNVYGAGCLNTIESIQEFVDHRSRKIEIETSFFNENKGAVKESIKSWYQACPVKSIRNESTDSCKILICDYFASYNPENKSGNKTNTITVTGVIKDSETNETIPMAHVIAVTSDGNAINKDEGGVLGITSNITDGQFELSNVPSDAKIKISCVGYQDQIVSAGQNLDIKLVKSTEMLDDVEVVAKKIKEGDLCEKPEEKIKKGQYKKIDGRYVCVPNEENKDLEKSVLKAEKSVQKAKEREQTLANRLTSGISMGATGIGGMMVAESLSEQRVDNESEQDMSAYMETFRCEYANGKSVKNGATNVELPADTLFDLYQEYIALAADLKERKEQLGLAPGIESEVIIDKATAGLYDDRASEKINGTYASLYRALSDETSEDAKQWTEQKEKTSSNLRIGAGVAIGGALVGLVGNIIDEITFNAEDEMFDDAVFDSETGDCIENCHDGRVTNLNETMKKRNQNTQKFIKKFLNK